MTRTLARRTLLVLAALGGLAWAPSNRLRAAEKPAWPNILFAIADDWSPIPSRPSRKTYDA